MEQEQATRAPAARLVAVRKRYEAAQVGPLELTFERGVTTALLGPSGCGKSTVLRMLNGLVAPDAGHVEVLGERLAATNLRRLRQRTGYMLQDGGLFPHLSGRENATLLARHLGRDAAYLEARLDALCALVQLPRALLERLPSELSGGQRQRVALVRALFLEPSLVLLDEPLGALDPLVRAALQRDLREVFRSLRCSVVLVTHDLAEAAYLADAVVLLREGRVVQRGTLDEFERAPAEPFVREFVTAQRSLWGGAP